MVEFTRQPDLAEQVPGPSNVEASNFAIAVATSMGREGSESEIKRTFMETGNNLEWQSFRAAFNSAKAAENQDIILDNARQRLIELEQGPQDPAVPPTNNVNTTAQDAVGQLMKVAEQELTGEDTGDDALEAFIRRAVSSRYKPTLDTDEIEQNVWDQGRISEIIQSEKEQNLHTAEFFLENVETMRDEWLKGDIAEMIGGMVGEFVYFSDDKLHILNSLYYSEMWRELAEAVGANSPGFTGQLKDLADPGSVIAALQEFIIKQDPQGRRDARVIMEDYLANNPHAWTDLRKIFVSQFVAPALAGEFTATEDVQALETGMFLLFDVLGLTGLWKLFRPVTFGGGPSSRILSKTNKDKYRNLIERGLTIDGELEDMGVDPRDAAQGQMPKPDPDIPGGGGGKLDDIPTILEEDVERIAALQAKADDLVATQRRNLLSEEERLTAVAREARMIELSFQGALRSNLTTMRMHEDGNGVTFNVTVGKNERVGFLSERTAFEQVEAINADGLGVRVYISDGETMRPYLTGKEALEELELIRNKDRKARRGNFYVQFERDYFFGPMDRLLFGDDVNLGPRWLGGFSKDLLTPSAIFGRRVYEPYLNNFLGEQAMVGVLDRIITPIFQLKPQKRRNIAEMYEWSNSVGMKERRNVTMDEVIQNFPDAGTDEYRGFYLLRKFYDTIYNIQNGRVYRDWNNQGFKTLTHAYGKLELHGKPLTRDSVNKYVREKAVAVYDPEINGTRVIDSAELDALYKRGGSVLEAELTIKIGDDAFHKLFLHDPKNINWRLEKLSEQPLEYIPGYWPRIYEDYYFIEKVVDNASVDGIRQRHTYATHVVGTQAEAERLLIRLEMATQGKGITWRIRDPGKDPRLSEKDRIAMDRERLQVEGRLFFDNRNQDRLPNAQGNPADIVDPVNALQRTSRMVARQVATEELINGYKNSFVQQFGDLVPDIGSHTSGEVGQILNKMVKDSGGDPRIVSANNVWNYIRIMEGSVKRSPNAFKKLAIQGAEFVAEQLQGIPSARRPSEWLFRNAHRAAPIEAAKSLAFFDFIVTRPIRQLVLQGSQHMFIQALDPTYAGRWQMDTFLLRQGLARTVIEESGGKKLVSQMITRNAKLMGVSEEDYLILIDQMDKSGLVQGINVHSLAGEVGVSIEATAADRIGDAVQATVNTATIKPVRDMARRKGFEAGEGFNVVASWLMALRQWRKTHGDKAIKDLTVDDWEEVKAMGSNYALAMVRPNAAEFQYGILSLPLQFVQFSHKAFLTMVRAIPGPIGQMGNKAFTPEQARKLVLGQMVLFGLGAGFGVKPEVEAALESSGLGHFVGTEVSDIIAGGMVDWLIDKQLQFISGDEDLNLGWDEFLAPGANVINIARNLYEIAFETAVFDGFLGPSEHTFSRMMDGYRLARYAITRPDWDATTRTTRALEAIASGAMSGYSDFFKARVAQRRGYWLSGSGQYTEHEAKWEEIMAKGLLGLNPDYKTSQYEGITRTDDWAKEIQDAGKEWARVVNLAYQSWSENELSTADRDTIILGQLALLEAFDDDPETFNALLEAFQNEMARLGQTRESYTDYIINSMWGEGVPPLAHTKAQIDKMELSDQDREDLKRFISLWEEESEMAGEKQKEILEKMREEYIDARE